MANYTPFDFIEDLLQDYPGIANSFVIVEEQHFLKNGDLKEIILIRLWVNKEIFDSYQVMETLIGNNPLKKQIRKICGKLSIPKYDIIYV